MKSFFQRNFKTLHCATSQDSRFRCNVDNMRLGWTKSNFTGVLFRLQPEQLWLQQLQLAAGLKPTTWSEFIPTAGGAIIIVGKKSNSSFLKSSSRDMLLSYGRIKMGLNIWREGNVLTLTRAGKQSMKKKAQQQFSVAYYLKMCQWCCINTEKSPSRCQKWSEILDKF